MRNNSIITKRGFCARISDRKAIRESLAPFAPFPEALNQDTEHQTASKKSKKRIN